MSLGDALLMGHTTLQVMSFAGGGPRDEREPSDGEDPIILEPPRPPKGGVEGSASHAKFGQTPSEMGRGLLGASLAGGRRRRAGSGGFDDSDGETASVASARGGEGVDDFAVGIDANMDDSDGDEGTGDWARGTRKKKKRDPPKIPPRLPMARRAGDPEPTEYELAAIEEQKLFARQVWSHPFTQMLSQSPPLVGDRSGGGVVGADASLRTEGTSAPKAPASGASLRHRLVSSGMFKAPPHVAAAVGRSLLRRL